GIRVEQRGARRVERGGDAHRELAFVFEDVQIVVDPDPRQVDQLVTDMYRLGGDAPLGEQPDELRHVALVGGRVSSHQQSDPHSISPLRGPRHATRRLSRSAWYGPAQPALPRVGRASPIPSMSCVRGITDCTVTPCRTDVTPLLRG